MSNPATVTDPPEKGATTKILSGPALWVALAAMIIWLGFSIFLMSRADSSNDLTWTRLAWVFGSVEAVAFAAAGALFGTAVQRDRAERAEVRADSAQADADARRDEAAKGRALAATVQADALTAPAGSLKSMGPGGQPAVDDVRRRHAELARSLFGDLV